MPNFRISSFKFKIGSYFGSHQCIEYRKNKVIHTYSDYPLNNPIHTPNIIERLVADDELKPLNEMLPSIVLWEKYSWDSDVTDGIEWSLHIHCGRQQIIRAGYCTFTSEYEKMEKILGELSGRKLFKEEA